MRRVAIPAALAATLALSTMALAQGGAGGGSSGGGAAGPSGGAGASGAAGSIPGVQGPVGHRQPRAADVPPGDVGQAPSSTQAGTGRTEARRDPAVERTLNSICRGC